MILLVRQMYQWLRQRVFRRPLILALRQPETRRNGCKINKPHPNREKKRMNKCCQAPLRLCVLISTGGEKMSS